MKLAFVVQRYGAEIAGGSEAECREYAERLARRHQITVLTTCARDYVTWANVDPPGTSQLNGVTVHRFPVARTRRLGLFRDLSDDVFAGGASSEVEDAWFLENGPVTPALLEHLRAHGDEYDLVLFFTFRYYPSYFGLPLVADRAVLVPTAEEDPAITLGVLPDYFAKPRGFVFNTPEEAALVETSAGRPVTPSAVVGFGIDPALAGDGRAELDARDIPEEFVLYVGRVDKNKGAHTLARAFLDHLNGGGRPTTLVVAGPPTVPLPEDPRIRSLGFVSHAMRDALLAHTRVLVVPSPYESLSIVLLEAWNRGAPALVNGTCQVLQGQVRRANGGLYYRSPAEFSEGLSYLLEHPEVATTMGRQGQAYVEREYRWPVVERRLEDLLEQVARRVATRDVHQGS